MRLVSIGMDKHAAAEEARGFLETFPATQRVPLVRKKLRIQLKVEPARSVFHMIQPESSYHSVRG